MDRSNPDPRSRSVRNVDGLAIPRVGEVAATTDRGLPWHITGLMMADAAVIDDFLLELSTNDCSRQTIRSYAFDLLRWWRFLVAIDSRWDTATREDVRDLVLWMRQPQAADKGRAFSPASINHVLSVLSVFYAHHARQGVGPVVNPVPAAASGVRRYAHHNPMDDYKIGQRAPYRQRSIHTRPRALPDELIDRVFATLTSTRDRALVAMYLATGARASELLGMTGRDVDWGNQAVGVISKGTRAYQWVPTSPDSLTWLRLYMNEAPQTSPGDGLWWTLRRPYRPLNYSAMRAVLERVNKALGSSITLHDFRHTCATRLANDPTISLTDVQAVLRHAHLSTTSRYIHVQTQEMLARVREHHQSPPRQPQPTNDAWGYDSTVLADLFGEPL